MDPDAAAVRLERLREKCAVRKAMKELRARMLEVLIGGLWHTTSEERYESIVECGRILVKPGIPDEDRWSTSQGPELYPFVRQLCGVSLFDFKNFDPDEYAKKCPNSNWTEFVPFRESWQSAVWIEIDRISVRDCLIRTNDLLEMWNNREGARPKLMPYIEAAYIGDIPTANFLRSFVANSNGIKPVD